ncbi:MAG: hypothetical protein OCD76_00920 [Reichenbachiella sp.]
MVDVIKESHDNKEDKPPVFKSWKAVYAIVLGFLVFTIAMLYWFKISY